MKLHYYPETKSLYIELAPGAAVDAVELGEGLVADIDSKGRVVGLDIDYSSSCSSHEGCLHDGAPK